MSERTEHDIDCERCQVTWHVEGSILRGFASFDMVTCQTCGADLREIRSDTAMPLVTGKTPWPKNRSGGGRASGSRRKGT